MMTWWFTTFMAPAIKQKVYNMSGVEYLYSTISQQQLEIPAYITEYDMVVSKNLVLHDRVFSWTHQTVRIPHKVYLSPYGGKVTCFLINS